MSGSTSGLIEPTAQDLRGALEDVLVPRLTRLLRERGAGHCMRVTELDSDIAVRLVLRLRGVVTGATVCLLAAAKDIEADGPLGEAAVTSTKLVELRNRSEENQAGSSGPLLVFVPPGHRASAEDSFGIATFEEVSLADTYELLAERLLEEVPPQVRDSVDELFKLLGGDQATARARSGYLLTLKANDFSPEVAGAAVFHFGLVPDFALYSVPGELTDRARRNSELVDKITSSSRSERQRVLELGFIDEEFTKKFAEFATRSGFDDPTSWTRRIVVDRENWGLSFGNWRLKERQRAELKIDVQDLELPRAGDVAADLNDHAELQSIAGQPYLLAGPKGVSQITVRFTVDPDPRRVDGLQRFRVEICSEQGGPIGQMTHLAVGKTAKKEFKPVLKKLNRVDLDEGWHYIKVTALDAQGETFLTESTGPEFRGGESERFYVVPDAETEEPPERSAGRFEGVTQALRTLQFNALISGDDPARVGLKDIRWKTGKRGAAGILQARIGTAGGAEIRLVPQLTAVQQSMLAEPEAIGQWRMTLAAGENTGASREDAPAVGAGLGSRAAEAYAVFLHARRAYFEAVLGAGDEDAVGDGLVTEAHDLDLLRPLLVAYAESYTELVAEQLRHVERVNDEGRGAALAALTELQQIDCVEVALTDGFGRRDTVLLVSPTHPLRALWLATWADLGRDWLTRLAGADRAHMLGARDSLLSALSPLGFPYAVPRRDGRLMVAAEDLTPYWGAFLPSEHEDPRGLLGRLAEALQVPKTAERTGGGASGLSGKHLADRVERYMRLHPYVQTLVLNAVNANSGALLAAMLLELQRRPFTRDLSYDIRLCVPDPEAPEAGRALSDLLSAQGSAATAEAEAFLAAGGGALRSKLAFSVRSIEEFEQNSEQFSAHLTVLLDAFGGERHGSAEHRQMAGAPVHGLVQSATSEYSESAGEAIWRKVPRFGPALAVEEGEDLALLMGRLPELLATAAATVATGGNTVLHVPCTTLTLEAADRALLYQAHQVSDWVVTVDRALGLEYFDHSGNTGQPEYLIDFAPGVGSGLAHQIIVSSRSVEELRALLAPTVAQHGLDVEQRHLQTFFEQLQLLSGNLGFKLASSAATQRTEVLGLALARLYLDYQGVLSNQIVVPLDAHLDLYSETRKQSRELGEALSFQRSDLALFHLDARTQTVTCRLVEVKCYTALHDVGAYQQLKVKVAEQIDRSQEVLAASFDPHRAVPDRVDRSVKNLTLESMLRFYLERALRHGSMAAVSYEQASDLLDRLDKGYRLNFTRSGLIFDLARTGSDREDEHGVEFHRIGLDLIRELIEAIPTEYPAVGHKDESEDGAELATAGGKAASRRAPVTLSALPLTVPRLPDAAFRVPDDLMRGVQATPPEPKFVPDEVRGQCTEPVSAPSGSPATESAAEPPAPAAPASAETRASDQGGTPQSKPSDIVVAASPSLTVVDTTGFHSAPTADAPAHQLIAAPDVFLGTMNSSPQYGVLGDVAGRSIALDLNETHTISLFGVQGGGKSYTLGSIMEMASLSAPPINLLPHPLATIVFHYSQTQDYAPEFTSMVRPNDQAEQLKILEERYGARPQALEDVLLLAPADQVEQRRREYPDIDVKPLKFSSRELQAAHWRFLMGAVGNQSTYIRQLTRIMRAHRHDLSLAVIRQGVEESGLQDHLKQLAQERLNLAAEYIDDSAELTAMVRPGRLIIVDLRDEFIEKDEALGLFVVLMQLFAEAKNGEEHFNKLVVFDEAHKYIESPDLVAGLVETVREMRHKGMSILVASQDPPSVPVQLIELSNHIILHKFTSPAWLKHIQKANASLSGLSAEAMARLAPGEAYVWSSKSSDAAFSHGAVRMRCRPRITRHGGATKTAAEGR
ncbi:methylation-associated defense system ATP-binding protein MAD8 [Streptomyces atroolivaceus]|uniref:methylation-associated defense system ATP-binding protein MAD8 n=1 Tax=Streptomyces atroolivaceus TaxID=66869 RepID=UPI003643CDE8